MHARGKNDTNLLESQQKSLHKDVDNGDKLFFVPPLFTLF